MTSTESINDLCFDDADKSKAATTHCGCKTCLLETTTASQKEALATSTFNGLNVVASTLSINKAKLPKTRKKVRRRSGAEVVKKWGRSGAEVGQSGHLLGVYVVMY